MWADPIKREVLIQCWLHVGPASATLAQHKANIGSLTFVSCFAGIQLPASYLDICLINHVLCNTDHMAGNKFSCFAKLATMGIARSLMRI